MIRRMLTAAGVAVVVSGMAVSSVWAAPTGRADSALLPRTGQWWFTSWKILPRVWPLTQGAGVTVAVLDTGVQASVPDLRGAVVPGGDVTGHRTNGETDFNTDGDGHGTMMSVLIAGQGYGTGMAGVAPKAKILPVVVNAGATDMTADPRAMAAGIIYAANHGAKVIDVPQEHPAVSTSGCDAAEQAAVAYALARDIVVIAAAGDASLSGAGPSEPASCAGVLAVGSVQPNRVLWPGDARQPYITVVNPGADLITSGRDGRLLANVSGTRAASALAAGAVALIRSRYPAMPWYRVIQRLTGTAVREGGAVPNDSFGYGILRLSQAVNATAFPVGADAPDPVSAKFRAWLATPQGRSVSRQLTKPGAPPQTPQTPQTARAARAGTSGSATPVVVAIIALLAALGAGAVAYRARATRPVPAGAEAARGRHVSRGRRWNHPPREESEATFPDLLAREDISVLLAEPDDFPYGDQAGEYLPLGDTSPYRIPPYSPAPGDGPLAPGRDDPRILTGMDAPGDDQFFAELRACTAELARIVEGDLERPVPACPGWTFRQLAVHVGRGHRWAAQIVATRATAPIPMREVADGKLPEDPARHAPWLNEGTDKVIEAVTAAGDDPVWTMTGMRPASFWARRRAHEAAVHMADAQLAIGRDVDLAPGFAADGVDEWLALLTEGTSEPDRARARELRGEGQSLHFHATDPGLTGTGEWQIRRIPSGVTVERGHGKADLAVRGPATSLLLVLTRRLPATDPSIEVFGDQALLTHWLEHTPF